MSTFVYILVALLVALQAADIWTTQRTINSGTGEESNPLAKWLFKFLPQSMWWVPKVAMVGPVCVGALMFPGIEAALVLGVMCAGYSYVVWQNYRIGSGQ